MITQLSIRGLAIIEELQIEFSPQLNVITGETGAGKSILIKALHFLLGAKADTDVIRQGFTRAHVAASFLLPRQHASIELLAEHGLIEEQDLTELIIRREISLKGRSQSWVNDQPITLSFLKEVGQSLIDIYGQHENHRMLDPSTHLEYIDQFLKDASHKQQLQSSMGQIHSLLGELRRRLDQYHSKRREQDYLQFRFDELSHFEPSNEDYARTLEICQDAARSLAEQKLLSQAQAVCDEGYQGRSLGSALQDLGRFIEQSRWLRDDKDIQGDLQQLRELGPVLDQLSYRLGRVASRKQLDEDDIERSESRLAGYQALFRKLGVRSIEEMTEEYQRLERELSFVNLAPEELGQNLQTIAELVQLADGLARKLSDERQKAAQRREGTARSQHEGCSDRV
jgi:DNA repair protein RecN (Recombination protein N)